VTGCREDCSTGKNCLLQSLRRRGKKNSYRQDGKGRESLCFTGKGKKGLRVLYWRFKEGREMWHVLALEKVCFYFSKQRYSVPSGGGRKKRLYPERGKDFRRFKRRGTSSSKKRIKTSRGIVKGRGIALKTSSKLEIKKK